MPSIMRLDPGFWAKRGASLIGHANDRLATSVGRLSSGERLMRASDDVASLSISSQLGSRIAALRMARVNMTQANSLLQVMDGGLRGIDEALQRMSALSSQASSGALSDAERGFLHQEFDQLLGEIDRIANQTEFGGIHLLNANAQAEAIYVDAAALDDRSGQEYYAMLTFGTNWTANNRTIRLGTFDTAPDERFYWRNNTALGNPDFNFQNYGSLLPKLQSMVNRWNDPNGAIQQDERFSGVEMELIGNSVKVTARSRGALSQLFAISDLSAHADVRNSMEVLGEDFQRNAASTLFNYVLKASNIGSETGLVMGSTSAAGSTGGGLLAEHVQTSGEMRLRVTGNIANNQQLRIDDGQNALLNFVFRTPATATNPFLHIPMGTTTTQTLDNAVAFLNNFVTYNQDNAGYSTWYSMAHLSFSREGNELVIRHKLPGNPVDLLGNAYNFRETLTAGTLDNDTATGANLDMINGVDTGVNAAGVINRDFVGSISGFEAVHVGTNRVNMSVKVGDATYTAHITDTNLQANDRVRFFSDDHGYFDVDLASTGATRVNNQTEADAYARQFDTAFSGLTFYQQRTMTNFEPEPPSPLVGAVIQMKLDDFNTPRIVENFQVSPSGNGGTARLSMTVNGETFISTQLIDRGIGPTASVTLHSRSDYNRTITFTNTTGNHIDLTTEGQAEAFEIEMRKFLPFGHIDQSGGGALSFQADVSSSNVLLVRTVDATTASLFGTGRPDISTKESAQAANDATLQAIAMVTSMRAAVGASQQQSNMALDTIQSAITNQSSARSQLADTDVAAESTQVALDFVRLNAGIATLSQFTTLHTDMVRDVVESVAAGEITF